MIGSADTMFRRIARAIWGQRNDTAHADAPPAQVAQVPSPKQAPDLNRLAQYQATRRAIDAAAEGKRLALVARVACRGDDAQIAAFRWNREDYTSEEAARLAAVSQKEAPK
jgi:subtilisin family serine protease